MKKLLLLLFYLPALAQTDSTKVLEEVKANDKSTQILLDYNKIINEDSRVETVLLPIRDGLTVSRVL